MFGYSGRPGTRPVGAGMGGRGLCGKAVPRVLPRQSSARGKVSHRVCLGKAQHGPSRPKILPRRLAGSDAAQGGRRIGSASAVKDVGGCRSAGSHCPQQQVGPVRGVRRRAVPSGGTVAESQRAGPPTAVDGGPQHRSSILPRSSIPWFGHPCLATERAFLWEFFFSGRKKNFRG